MKDLHAENDKTLIKEIEDDSKKWKDTPCSWIGRINILKMTILPKAIYRFNARRKWQITPVFFPRKFHGQRSLAGYSPWGCKESDRTDHATHTIKLPMTFSTELEQITIKFIWNHKKIQNCQSIPEKKEQSRRHNPPRHQTILQSHSNQSSMVLAQKQT